MEATPAASAGMIEGHRVKRKKSKRMMKASSRNDDESNIRAAEPTGESDEEFHEFFETETEETASPSQAHPPERQLGSDDGSYFDAIHIDEHSPDSTGWTEVSSPAPISDTLQDDLVNDIMATMSSDDANDADDVRSLDDDAHQDTKLREEANSSLEKESADPDKTDSTLEPSGLHEAVPSNPPTQSLETTNDIVQTTLPDLDALGHDNEDGAFHEVTPDSPLQAVEETASDLSPDTPEVIAVSSSDPFDLPAESVQMDGEDHINEPQEDQVIPPGVHDDLPDDHAVTNESNVDQVEELGLVSPGAQDDLSGNTVDGDELQADTLVQDVTTLPVDNNPSVNYFEHPANDSSDHDNRQPDAPGFIQGDSFDQDTIAIDAKDEALATGAATAESTSDISTPVEKDDDAPLETSPVENGTQNSTNPFDIPPIDEPPPCYAEITQDNVASTDLVTSPSESITDDTGIMLSSLAPTDNEVSSQDLPPAENESREQIHPPAAPSHLENVAAQPMPSEPTEIFETQSREEVTASPKETPPRKHFDSDESDSDDDTPVEVPAPLNLRASTFDDDDDELEVNPELAKTVRAPVTKSENPLADALSMAIESTERQEIAETSTPTSTFGIAYEKKKTKGATAPYSISGETDLAELGLAIHSAKDIAHSDEFDEVALEDESQVDVAFKQQVALDREAAKQAKISAEILRATLQEREDIEREKNVVAVTEVNEEGGSGGKAVLTEMHDMYKRGLGDQEVAVQDVKDTKATEVKRGSIEVIEEEDDEEEKEHDVHTEHSQIDEERAAHEAEWANVETFQKERKAKNTEPFRLIGFKEAFTHFQEAPYVHIHHDSIVVEDEDASPSSGCLSCFRPLVLNFPTATEQRDLVFCIARCGLDTSISEHYRMLQTIYQRLTNVRGECPLSGSHWEVVGFQGNDPSTDLRGAGMLGLLQILYLVETYPDIAAKLFAASRHETYHFPLCCVLLNLSVQSLVTLRRGRLIAICNKEKDVMIAVNKLYSAMGAKLFSEWKTKQGQVDFPILLKDTTTAGENTPQQLIDEMATALAVSRGSTPSSNDEDLTDLNA
ncbi:hypothetical protein Ae201684P_016081 [Aphanomyces euteiches]|uniref:ELMO domain-containing protein n=1 Tax=Aphanomyces euteiches TaxID=100861 RepID=A0A6G0XJS8_9STRA|nr:hypothetical protein Ae201684_004155 [Aphanomyces euteiches]KAH9093452.1 hypothetical protein Ae201684P_016081 [Aphanomyces euteiches]